ncbi:MAG: hypothetical protein ACO1SV_08160 [Fimbriimonas sp.]
MDDEPDYLARAQPDFDPGELRHVVKDVFALEYGVTKDYQIADIVGRDKSRISQLFSHPEKAKPETIEWLVSHIKNPRNRERVVEAWARVHGPDVGAKGASDRYIGETVTEVTRKRIDRLIRLEQLPLAARLSFEAAQKAGEGTLRETLLDRAYFLHQRLDRPGTAMAVARLVALGARRRGEPHREAGAAYMRCRILLGLADATADELLPGLDAALILLRGLGDGDPTEYLTATTGMVESLRDDVLVALMERGRYALDEEHVRRVLGRCVAEGKRAKQYQRRFGSYLMASRCALLLGNPFQAEEFLEKAFRSGYEKNLHLYQATGVVKSRIMAATGTAEERADYLFGVLGNCSAGGDAYHRRLAEWDMARVQSEMFPPAVPAE